MKKLLLIIFALAGSLTAAPVWTPDPLEDIAPGAAGNFTLQPQPIRIVAPINGIASGQVVVKGGITGARASDLTGPGRIPASAISFRCAVAAIPERGWSFGRFDALVPRPVKGDGIQPLWVTVRVPADAAPGQYRGAIAVSGATVPLELTVGKFHLPHPRDWASFVSTVESPEAVAWTYGVPMWSDAHLEKLAASLHLQGQLGNDVGHMTVVRKTHFGNDHGTIVFRKERGKFVPDFGYAEKYMALYDKLVGKPKVFWIYLWEKVITTPESTTVPISVIGPDGKLTEDDIPKYGLGPADDAWRALIDGLRQRAAALGWDPACIMAGAAADGRPTPESIAFFNSFQPPVRWVVFSHWRGDKISLPDTVISDGLIVGFGESPDGPSNRDFVKMTQLGGGWSSEKHFLFASSFRGWVVQESPAVQYRFMPDATISGDKIDGFTRLGLDGWMVTHPETKDRTATLTRYRNSWHNLWRYNPTSITAPGAEGAIATIRYEMVREGLQEAEARVVLEKALVGGKLPPAKTKEIEAFLRERNSVRYGGAERVLTAGPNWQAMTARLFDLAGEVQELKLGR